MPPLLRTVLLLFCVYAAACGGERPDPGQDSGSGSGSGSGGSGSGGSGGSGDGSGGGGSGGSGATQLTGGERVGWNQRADSPEALAGLTFVMYVDDVRQGLSDAACGALNAQQVAECEATIPPMTAGPHTVALAAMDAGGRESERSPSYQVNVVVAGNALAVQGGLGAQASAGGGGAAGHASLRVQVVVSGLHEPTDLVIAPDSRVLVAERAGTIRIVEEGGIRPQPALVLTDVVESLGGLLGVELDPAFARSGFVYVLYTAADGYRVSRYREAAGRFVDRVVLLDRVPATANGSAALRFGPDGTLYVALGGERGEQDAADAGSYNGKVLRFNADGTVPEDQAGFTPVFATSILAARSLAWAPDSRSLWVAAGRLEGSGLLNGIVNESGPRRRGQLTTRYALPDGQLPGGLLFYRGGLFEDWQGDLLVTLPGSAQLLRVELDPAEPARVAATELLLRDAAAGSVRAVAEDADGVIYVVNDHQLLTMSPGGPSAPEPGLVQGP